MLQAPKTGEAIMNKRHARRTAEQWSAIIEQQAQSGLPIKVFCEEQNLGFSTFSKWKRKLQQNTAVERKSLTRATPAFEPVEIVPDNSVQSIPATRITLSLDEGITLSIERTIPAP